MKDAIVGKIYFLLVRIKIKHMEIQIIKRETTGSGNITVTCTIGQRSVLMAHDNALVISLCVLTSNIMCAIVTKYDFYM